MLKNMRKSAESGIMKVVIYGMLMLGAIGLAFTGGSSFLRDGLGGDTNVASIGRVKIDGRAFDRIVRQNLTQKGIDARTALQMGYINQLLEQQIAVNLMGRATADLGIAVSDDITQQEIRKVLAPGVKSGLSMKDAARQIMRGLGMSEPQFIEAVRSDAANTIVRGAFDAGISVESDSEARDLALYANEKRTVQALFLPDSSIRDYKTPDDAVLKPFYQAGQERYAVPETRNFTLAVMTGKALAKKDITDEELRKIYEEQKKTLALPERRTLEQAILPSEDQAKAVLAAVKKGEGLKASVKAVTGDTKDYSGTETYQQDGLDPKLADAAFAAKKGDAAGPVQTPLGWHVLVVQDIKTPEVQSFASVKDKLRAAAESNNEGEALYTLSTQLDDTLAGGGSLDDAVKTYKLDTATIGPVHQDGSTPDKTDGLKNFAADSAVILKSAFGLAPGEISNVFSLSGGRYAVVRLDTVTPKSYKPFDEVKGELSKLWIADQQNVLNKDRAKDALAKLKAGSATMNAVAQSAGGSVNTVQIDRLAAKQPEPLTPSAAASLFRAGKGEYVMQATDKGVVIGRVETVTLPDPAKIPADKIKAVGDAAVAGMREDILAAWLGSMRKKYNVTVNDRLLQTMYGKDSGTGDDPNQPNDQ